MKRDGHIHTPFCPHGTKDSTELYIEKAIKSGFTDISFTEHAPLPVNFPDPTPNKDSGMNMSQLSLYIEEISHLKNVYQKDIHIRLGLEVDFIAGFEKETRSFLDEFGPDLDDAILSVHFLQVNNRYFCCDFSQDVFAVLSAACGSIEATYELYYNTVDASIQSDLGQFKPKRIGHPTLIHKFQLAHNETINDDSQIRHILQLMKKTGCELDVNGAGFSKTDCQESYPPLNYIEYAKSLGIPLVFGSDAHNVNGLHKHYEKFYTYLS
ncbi:histidinol-phosphatase [Planococcus antarcticus DSM 14505]|uniref:Histidinol-phosphatase n=1 Tax=Planococcus antarcticus DSM 14505 TaxID=1185653 RepID=A0AA87LTW2_9BACL|nr:histidinol-phosphatase HisJ [Planococcus antarcticus]EIM06627.1 histidinol-phosphatase [Planococcus antarcticus DSM 14505]